MRRNRHRRGITLLELLLAVTLLSLLATGLLWSMRIGLNTFSATQRRVEANRRSFGAQRILEQQFAGFMPVIGRCMAPNQSTGAVMPFFQGAPTLIRFVSTYSLTEAARGLPRIVEFAVIEGEPGEGVRLVVNEHLYTGPRSMSPFCPVMTPEPQFPPPQIGPGTFVLADKLAYCRFAYQVQIPDTPESAWVAAVAPTAAWPLGVRIDMAPVKPDPSRLQALEFTAQLRITKPPMETYEK